MCGIAGIVHADPSAKVSENSLRGMCDAIRHRGPDDEGYFVEGAAGLGMRRLSIIDVAGGHQPIFNEDRSCAIVFNGEIYGHRETRSELERRGHHYRTNSDTETILHAYDEFGDDFVEHIRGMFAVAIWDQRRRRLVLARDRMGQKPLYYTEPSGPTGRLAFASEIKAILTLDDVERGINPQAVVDYVGWGYVPSPLSIYKGISKLPPAHVLVYEDGNVRVRKFWDIEPLRAGKPRHEEYYVDRALELLDECVRIRLESEVPLGTFLSGGTDSSIVTALMARHTSGRVKTFSIGFEADKYNELPYARGVAEHFGTDHHEEIVRPDSQRDVATLVRQFDEPFADSSMIPTYYVSRLARTGVTVALSGDGGDELFAGYLRYLDNPYVRIMNRIPALFRDPILRPLTRIVPPGMKGIDRLRDLIGGPDEQYVRKVTGGLSVVYADVFSDELMSMVDHADPAYVAQPFLDAVRSADALTRRQYLDVHTYLDGDILTKVDRTSMMVSLEARAPLVDHVLAEFAATIPVELRMKGATTKYLLKKVAERLMPRELVYRPKKGFAVPVAYWLRAEWAAHMDDLILGESALARGTFRPEYLRRIVAEHRSGKRDNSGVLWTLMMLELWRRDAGV